MIRRIPALIESWRGTPIRRALHTDKFYINGEWRAPARLSSPATRTVSDPATGESLATLALGSSMDVDAAVESAFAAFDSWSASSKAERLVLLERLLGLYKDAMPEMAEIISSEMGAPIRLAKSAQAMAGLGHIQTAIRVLSDFDFEERHSARETLRYEAVGVCGCITPWNCASTAIEPHAWPRPQRPCG